MDETIINFFTKYVFQTNAWMEGWESAEGNNKKRPINAHIFMISAQAYGGVVAFQGRSHRDWGELLGLILSKFAKRIQSWDKKLK